MPSVTATSKLDARQARVLHDADVHVKRVRAQLQEAEEKLAEIKVCYRDRIPGSPDLEEAQKGICIATVGGVTIRVAPAVTADSFSLKRYTDAGHPVTDEMTEAIRPGRPYDRWTIKATAGPKKLDAVEP